MIKQQSANGSPLRAPANVGRRDNALHPRSIFSNDILLYTSATPAVRSLVVSSTQTGSRRDAFFKLSMHEWLRLMLAVVVTITSLAFLLLAPFLTGRPPDLGFTIAPDPAGRLVVQHVVPNGMAYNLGVRPGDPVLSYWNLGEADTASTIALEGGNGQAVEVSTTSVQAISPLQKFSYLFLSLIFIAVGAPVYVKARQRTAASTFYLFCIASAICLTTATVISHQYPWLLVTMFVGLSVWAAAFAIFFLKFPLKVGKTIRQHNFIVTLILLCGFATVGLYIATFFDPDLYPAAQLTDSVYLALCTVIGLGSLVKAFFIQRSKFVQNQLSVLVIGTSLAVCPTLLLVMIPKFFGMAGLEVEFTALSLGIMPLALAYAITQHQLLGIRGLVRRGVTYVMMGFVVLMIFSLGAVSLSAFLPEGWYHGDFGLLAVSAFVFVMALSYGYTQRTVETWVDKFIYHDGYDYKEALLDFSSQLATEQDLDKLSTNLVERTCNLMNLTCGVLLLAEHPDGGPAPKGDSLEDVLAGEDSGHQISKDMRVTPYAQFGQGADWLIEGLQKELADLGIHLVGSAPTQLMYFNNGTQAPAGHDLSGFHSGPLYDNVDQIRPSGEGGKQAAPFNGDGGPAQRAGTRAVRSFLGVPLWTRQRFVGMLCLGNKRTGEAFTKDDLALLGTLSTQASLAIYNAQLFEAQREALLGTIEALAHAIEAKDGYTIKHCERMTERATALAQAMHLPDHDIENIRLHRPALPARVSPSAPPSSAASPPPRAAGSPWRTACRRCGASGQGRCAPGSAGSWSCWSPRRRSPAGSDRRSPRNPCPAGRPTGAERLAGAAAPSSRWRRPPRGAPRPPYRPCALLAISVSSAGDVARP